jgi:hypothetical protein
MTAREFESTLYRPPGMGTWTYLDIPFSVAEAFGRRGQARVRGTVNGHPFRGAAMPHGDGTHYLVVNRAMREAVGAVAGDLVTVTMETDDAPLTVTVPADLEAALAGDPEVLRDYQRL